MHLHPWLIVSRDAVFPGHDRLNALYGERSRICSPLSSLLSDGDSSPDLWPKSCSMTFLKPLAPLRPGRKSALVACFIRVAAISCNTAVTNPSGKLNSRSLGESMVAPSRTSGHVRSKDMRMVPGAVCMHRWCGGRVGREGTCVSFSTSLPLKSYAQRRENGRENDREKGHVQFILLSLGKPRCLAGSIKLTSFVIPNAHPRKLHDRLVNMSSAPRYRGRNGG